MTKKKLYIIGNWKMNPQTLDEAKQIYAKTNKAASKTKKVTVAACVPYIYLAALARTAKKFAKLGVQDVFPEFSGSWTGGVSAPMAKGIGAEYAIVGHSERRFLGDTNEIVAKKLSMALSTGLTAIICVGEMVRDEGGKYLEDIRSQVTSAFAKLPKKDFLSAIIAYEPVWAVGKSYDTALKPEDIHEMALFIKKTLADIYPKDDAMRVPVLYGGSVDLENAKAILSDGEVNGLLIGRQSLDTDNFSKIIEYAASL